MGNLSSLANTIPFEYIALLKRPDCDDNKDRQINLKRRRTYIEGVNDVIPKLARC